MADTGAPWNLPYPLPTDLVRDGAQAIEDLAEATATGLSLAVNAGIGSNVVSVTKVDPFTTTSTSFVVPTGLTVTITPTAATSKILVIATMVIGNSVEGSRSSAQLFRDATAIAVSTGGTGTNQTFAYTGVRIVQAVTSSVAVLDSPETTSPVTYEYRVASGNAAWTTTVNRRGDGSTDNAVSTITAIEVAA